MRLRKSAKSFMVYILVLEFKYLLGVRFLDWASRVYNTLVRGY